MTELTHEEARLLSACRAYNLDSEKIHRLVRDNARLKEAMEAALARIDLLLRSLPADAGPQSRVTMGNG